VFIQQFVAVLFPSVSVLIITGMMARSAALPVLFVFS